LQEETSEREYGSLLGRLVCFYIRLIELKETDETDPRVQWFQTYPLKEGQLERLCQLKTQLELESNDSDLENVSELDDIFHQTIMELFCWRERRSLLDEIDCPVQRFLMVVCLRREGNGFIPVRDIPPIIAKLMYAIRATVYVELIKRQGTVFIEDDLDGLQAYVKDLVQTPFGFLSETMHLASYIAGEASALPQITWIGKEHKSLAIHGKRVDWKQIQSLAAKVLKDIKRMLEFNVKKGMTGLKGTNWKMFDPEDDLSNCDLNYSFVNKAFDGKRMNLLTQFLENQVTDKYFTKGKVGDDTLWNKKAVMAWLKDCKKLLQHFAVSCHVEGGQPSRGREFTTVRWKNGCDEMRGVLWAHGTMFLLGRYSKVRSQVSHDRLIPRYQFEHERINGNRFLPLDIAILLTEYLAIVRPVEIWFCELYNLKGKDDLKEFLWADYKKGVWDGNDLSNLLKTFTIQHGMRPLGLSEYRQVAIAFMEQHFGRKVYDEGSKDENIFNIQAGHGSLATNASYAIAAGDSRIITREALYKFSLASEAWKHLVRSSEAKAIGLVIKKAIAD